MARHIVATVGEIPPGGRKIVEAAGRSIGVFNVGGEYFALRNRCPHQGGPLCEGLLWGLLEASEPGEFAFTRRGAYRAAASLAAASLAACSIGPGGDAQPPAARSAPTGTVTFMRPADQFLARAYEALARQVRPRG